MNTTTTMTTVDQVVAAVVGRGAQKLSTIDTIAFETELPVPELRVAVRQAVKQGLIRCGASSALGAYYYAA